MNKLHPLITFYDLKKRDTIIAYHASENPNFIPNDKTPLHVGSIQQAISLVEHMKSKYKNKKFYLNEIKVDIGKLSTVLYDEDPKLKSGDFDSYAYSNRIEFPAGLRFGNNISLMLMKPSKRIMDIKMIKGI